MKRKIKMEEKYTVYMHYNKFNKKRYIGITKRNVEERWLNGQGYRGNQHFYKAIKKYGWDAFLHLILYSGLSKEEACKKEKYLIKLYDTMNPLHGYNNCAGGEGVSGYHHLEETKEMIRNALLGSKNHNFGKKMSEEQKEKISKTKTGSKLSEEHKKKIGDSLRGQKYHDDEFKRKLAERNAVAVMRSDGVIFNSVTEAAQSVGLKQPAISNAIHRGSKSGGYTWSYVKKEA